MTQQARDAYHLKEAHLEAIQRIKRAFPEWANNREVWCPTRRPDGLTWEEKKAWDQPDNGVPKQHVDVWRALIGRYSGGLQGAVHSHREAARAYDQTPKLQLDREYVRRAAITHADNWRPRSAPKVRVGAPGQLTKGQPRTYYRTPDVDTITVGHRWAARIAEHLDGDPIVDDQFVVLIEPYDHDEFQMFQALLYKTAGRDNISEAYIVVHAGFRSSGATPEKAIALHRRRAVKAVREQFSSVAA